MNIITLLSAAQIFMQFDQTKIAPKLAYKIMKFCKAVSVEEEFFNTKRNEIIDTYAVKDENGKVAVTDDGMISIAQDKILDANSALYELKNIEVDVPNIKFTLEELEAFELSVSDMFALDAFIEE